MSVVKNETLIVSVDWSHEEENRAIFDGKRFLGKMPPPKKGLVIVTENIPVRQAKPYIAAGIPIWVCNTDETKKERVRLKAEKSHEGDARILRDLYLRTPGVFRRMHIDEVFQQFKAYASLYGMMQKNRIQFGNQLYHDDDALAEEMLIDVEKLEEKILRAMEFGLRQMPIYTEFLNTIRGIGPSVSSLLIAHTGSIDRFATISKLRAYCGLHVVDGCAPRKEVGKKANWNHKLKSVLLGRMWDCFAKHNTPIYKDIYDREKARQLSFGVKLGHAHRRAIRKAMKEFLTDFYRAYRRLGRGDVVFKNMTSTSEVSKTRKKRISSEIAKARKKAEKLTAEGKPVPEEIVAAMNQIVPGNRKAEASRNGHANGNGKAKIAEESPAMQAALRRMAGPRRKTRAGL